MTCSLCDHDYEVIRDTTEFLRIPVFATCCNRTCCFVCVRNWHSTQTREKRSLTCVRCNSDFILETNVANYQGYRLNFDLMETVAEATAARLKKQAKKAAKQRDCDTNNDRPHSDNNFSRPTSPPTKGMTGSRTPDEINHSACSLCHKSPAREACLTCGVLCCAACVCLPNHQRFDETTLREQSGTYLAGLRDKRAALQAEYVIARRRLQCHEAHAETAYAQLAAQRQTLIEMIDLTYNQACDRVSAWLNGGRSWLEDATTIYDKTIRLLDQGLLDQGLDMNTTTAPLRLLATRTRMLQQLERDLNSTEIIQRCRDRGPVALSQPAALTRAAVEGQLLLIFNSCTIIGSDSPYQGEISSLIQPILDKAQAWTSDQTSCSPPVRRAGPQVASIESDQGAGPGQRNSDANHGLGTVAAEANGAGGAYTATLGHGQVRVPVLANGNRILPPPAFPLAPPLPFVPPFLGGSVPPGVAFSSNGTLPGGFLGPLPNPVYGRALTNAELETFLRQMEQNRAHPMNGTFTSPLPVGPAQSGAPAGVHLYGEPAPSLSGLAEPSLSRVNPAVGSGSSSESVPTWAQRLDTGRENSPPEVPPGFLASGPVVAPRSHTGEIVAEPRPWTTTTLIYYNGELLRPVISSNMYTVTHDNDATIMVYYSIAQRALHRYYLSVTGEAVYDTHQYNNWTIMPVNETWYDRRQVTIRDLNFIVAMYPTHTAGAVLVHRRCDVQILGGLKRRQYRVPIDLVTVLECSDGSTLVGITPDSTIVAHRATFDKKTSLLRPYVRLTSFTNSQAKYHLVSYKHFVIVVVGTEYQCVNINQQRAREDEPVPRLASNSCLTIPELTMPAKRIYLDEGRQEAYFVLVNHTVVIMHIVLTTQYVVFVPMPEATEHVNAAYPNGIFAIFRGSGRPHHLCVISAPTASDAEDQVATFSLLTE